VVTGAGQASIADAACADVPLVVVPGRRPYGEQDATAEALDSIPGVTVLRYGDGPTAVGRAVRRQVDRVRDGESGGIRAWWGVDGAAARAAEVIRAATTTSFSS
jgi:UDP-N-acetylglucosamine--N-acetylmuramyl-(pentapeptide) pyrophosphoryl-undecaprenol N-acetylglucosamine transferase